MTRSLKAVLVVAHSGIALTFAAASFADQRFGATILLYLVTAFVLGLAYNAWLRRKEHR